MQLKLICLPDEEIELVVADGGWIFGSPNHVKRYIHNCCKFLRMFQPFTRRGIIKNKKERRNGVAQIPICNINFSVYGWSEENFFKNLVFGRRGGWKTYAFLAIYNCTKLLSSHADCIKVQNISMTLQSWWSQKKKF